MSIQAKNNFNSQVVADLDRALDPKEFLQASGGGGGGAPPDNEASPLSLPESGFAEALTAADYGC